MAPLPFIDHLVGTRFKPIRGINKAAEDMLSVIWRLPFREDDSETK